MAGNNPDTSHSFARRVAPFAPLALAMLMHSGASIKGKAPQPNPPAHAPAAGGGFVPACTAPHFPSDTPASIDATDCGLDGNGGAESAQNDAKNNFCAADPATPITLAEMIDKQKKVQQDSSIPFGNTRSHPLTSKPGPATDRAPLHALGEGSLVTLQGFVKIARQENKESVNCGTHVANADTNHDIHISIVESPSQEECAGVVVEMVPHHRPPSWNADNVQAVADDQLPVRVTGQLMFDSSHTPCINGVGGAGDPKRASLWEIHPVYKFELCPQGNCSSETAWIPLETWKKP